jgi:M6 family metalloprotease-like protein
MKNLFTVLGSFLLITLLAFPQFIHAQRSNCNVAPYTNTINQPDGSKITLRALGNEAIHYLETEDGFTVLKNNNGFYEYAIADDAGNLTTSGLIARDGVNMKANVLPHLRYSSAQQNMLLQMHQQLEPNEPLNKAAGPYPFPSTGNRKILVVLVEYPDLRATIAKENFELLLNQPNYNGTGSFRDFFLATSSGKLNLESIVYGWVMADSSHLYYGRNSSPSYNNATRQLLLGALKDANDSFNVDFSQFDNDDDGFVDGVILMHAGIGAEEQSAPNANNYIWSFRSTLPTNLRPTYDGVQVSAYGMFPEKRYNGGAYSIVGIGVAAHEFGHLLDLPDLYSTQSNNEAAGNYSLMAGGPWLNNERTPCLNDAWSRIRMGWVTPTVITDTALYTLPYAVVDSDMVFRINTSVANEYYLLENRQRKGFDMYLPSKGLAIWHINTNRARLLSEASNNVNNDTSQLGVGIMQADGLRHLERNINRGDASDLYPLTANQNFTPTSMPASNLHLKVNGIRQPSNVAITDIKQLADSSIVFEYGMNSSASYTANRFSGCGPVNVNFTANPQGGDAYTWDLGDGQTANTKTVAKTFNKTGDYPVTLYLYKQGNLIDSNTQFIKVLETPEIDYEWVRDTGNYVTFVDKTLYGKTYAWTFTSDTVLRAYEANPTIKTSGPQKIQVKLTVTSNASCVKSRTDSIQIFALGLNNNIANQINLQAYPIPFNDLLQLNMDVKQNESAMIELFNITGQKMLDKRIDLTVGINQINLNTNSLKSGMHMVKVSTKAGTAWLKTIKE